MCLQDCTDNGEADSGALASGSLMLAPLIPFPYKIPVFIRDRCSRVDNRYSEAVRGLCYGDGDPASVLCVIDGIVQKIADYLGQLQCICLYHIFLWRLHKLQGQMVLPGDGFVPQCF